MMEKNKSRILDKLNRKNRNKNQEIDNEKIEPVGQFLKNIRLEKKETLEELSQILKIRPRLLKAIEEGNMDDLPGSAYAVGFVRSYASHYKVNPEEAINRFKTECQNAQNINLSLPEPLADQSFPTATIIIISVILIVLGYGVWFYISELDGKNTIAPLQENSLETTPSYLYRQDQYPKS